MSDSGNSQAKLQHQTIAGALVQAIRNRILTGQLGGGTQLRQEALAAEHGVSRIPVREALLQLEAEGFVVYSSHRGAVVKSLSLSELNEIFDLRAMIEPDVIRHAIPNWNEEVHARAKAALEEFNKALELTPDGTSWGELNWKFHEALSLPSGREHSLRTMRNLHRISSRYVITQLMMAPGSFDRAKKEHETLLQLCRDQKKAQAAKLIKEHVERTRVQLVDYLEKSPGTTQPA